MRLSLIHVGFDCECYLAGGASIPVSSSYPIIHVVLEKHCRHLHDVHHGDCLSALVLQVSHHVHARCLRSMPAMLSFDMLHAQVGCMILQLFIVGTR